jgi:nucleoside phosphorylase
MKTQIIKWLQDGNENRSVEILSVCKIEVSTSAGSSTGPDGISRRHAKVIIYAPRLIHDSIKASMAAQKKEIEAAIHNCAKANKLEIFYGIYWLPLIADENDELFKKNKEESLEMAMPADIDDSVDIVIITALVKEQEAVLRHLGATEAIQTKNRIYHKGSIPHEQGNGSYSVVVLSLPGMGNVQAALATSHAITVWNPRQIILAGITAGIKDTEMRWDSKWLGDIIVADQIIGYELGKIMDGTTNRRYQVVRPSFELIEAARNLPVEKWALSACKPRPDGSSSRIIAKVHFGVVASGEKIVADDYFAKELQSHWSQLAGIEMEAYGTALAAYQAETAPGMLMVKGICDWADSDKNDEWQEYAADISAAFLIALLRKAPFDVPQRPQALKKVTVKYSGKVKLSLSKKIGDDWRDLADILEIPPYKRVKFSKGHEMQEIWEWLEYRGKLDGLREALEFIDRPDLVKILNGDL